MFLNYRRSAMTYVLLWIFTFGIYHFIFQAQVAEDTNRAYGREVMKKPTGTEIFLTIISFGVYGIFRDLKTLQLWDEYLTERKIEHDIDKDSYRFLGIVPGVRILALRNFIDVFNLVCRVYTDEQLVEVEDEYLFIQQIRKEAAERRKKEEAIAGIAMVEEYVFKEDEFVTETVVEEKVEVKEEEKLPEQIVEDCFRNKKWFIRAFAAMLALFMLPILVVFTTVFILPPVYEDTFVGELAEKYDRLNRIDDDKIVVVGGSSVAFGLDSALIEDELGMEVVNFGLYANLGTKLMMDLSKANINQGDIVILAPEMNSQTLSLYFNSETTMQALDGNLRMLLNIDSGNYESLIGASWKFTCDKLGYLVTGNRPMNEGAYKKQNFNLYGDNIYDRPYNEMTGIQNTINLNFKTNYIDSIHSDFEQYVEYVNEYVAYCEARGAKVYFSFCPMNYAAMSNKNTEDSIKSFFIALCRDLDCKVISNVYDYILDEGYFFDSEFHLNNAGVTIRTVQLIDDIKREMGDISVTIPVRDLPAAPGYKPYSPDLEIEMSEDGGYWIVTGVTEEGLEKEEITVPDLVNDLPVTTISESAFSKAKNLKKIILGKYINKIEVYAFTGADSLVRIIVPDGIKPNTIEVPGKDSKSMIEDCSADLKIFVDSEYYDAYVSHETWSAYAQNLSSEHFNYVFEKVTSTDGDYWMITGVNEDGKLSEELTLPDVYMGAPVKVIGENAFSGCENLVKITLGANISEIKAKAFSNAPKLETVIFPRGKGPADIKVPTASGSLMTEGCSETLKIYVVSAYYEDFVTSVDYSAYMSFITCENIYLKLEEAMILGRPAWVVVGLTEAGKQLDEITIPTVVDGLPVSNIASEAFSGGKLTTLYIGENIANIEASAFKGANDLVKVIIPDSKSAEEISVPNNMAGTLAIDGCNPDLKIYVAAEHFEGYQADYFWGDYGTYLEPKEAQ